MSLPAVTIVVSPSLNADGHRAHSTRGQLFDAAIDGCLVVTRKVITPRPD
jgi:hypothetical protein